MSNCKEYIINYHHGGSLRRDGEIQYVNGKTTKFAVDPDKLCYWDMLGDVNELGYDIEKSVELFYMDNGRALKRICNDEGIADLCDQLYKTWTVDIFVESSSDKQDKLLPKVLLTKSGNSVEINFNDEHIVELDVDEAIDGGNEAGNVVGNEGDNAICNEFGNESGSVIGNEQRNEGGGGSGSGSGSDNDSMKDDEERLIDVPFISCNSDIDDEAEEAISKIRRHVNLTRELQGADNFVIGDDDVASTDEETDEIIYGNETGQQDIGKVSGYVSDYIDDSDPGSYCDNSEVRNEDDSSRYKSSSMIYDPNVPLDDFYLDLRFKDLKSFKSELIEFSTKRGFEFKYIKNDSMRIRARCAGKECKWLILCSWCSAKKMYVVKHYVSKHSCLLGTTKNKRVTAPFIAKRFGEVISAMSFIRARQLRAMVRAQLGVFITNKVCRNAKNLVLKKIEEQFKEDFKVLNNYALELKTANPGSNVVVVAERNNPNELPVFQMIYICLTAVKEGFLAGCRRLVGLDGCFLKGLLKGQLVVAVGRDGNNQMFPVAWALVQKETSQTWSWFLEHLRNDLCMGEGLGWSIVSDMQKGLINAVVCLLPFVEHRMCARHIYARWGKKYQGKELQIQFWNIARSTSFPEMQKELDQMKKLKGGAKAVDELLEKWPIQGWCQAFFSEVIKCEAIDNNMCEVFNGVILDARSKPVISMLEDIRQYVMTRIVVKRDYLSKWKGSYGPNIVAKLEKEKQKSLKWLVEWNGGSKHEVYWDNLMVHVREAYIVILAEQKCSCGKWDKTGLPCQHAMAAIAFQGEDVLNYLAHWFSKETYLKAYQFLVSPVRGREFWPVSDEGPMLPPLVKKMPGRPPKKRRREPLEGKNKSSTKLSRKGRIFTCSYCHVQGHNKVTCPKKTNIPVTTGDTKNISIKKKQKVDATKGKSTTPPTGNGSIKILRDTHSGGVIVGKENPQSSSFITASSLLARRNARAATAAKKKQHEVEQQTTTSFEFIELSTQQSITFATTKDKANP